MERFNVNQKEVKYLVFPIRIENETYNLIEDEITLLKKDMTIVKLSEIKHEFNINTKNARIIKHYICYPKGCLINS
jgi:hypothetical protein